MPKYPEYGKILTQGCTGFGKNIMKWPESLIIGGVGRDGNRQIEKIEAFQSVFLVASPEDLYQRLKRDLPHGNEWNPAIAQDVIQTWQRNFTEKIYNHRFNNLVSQRSPQFFSNTLSAYPYPTSKHGFFSEKEPPRRPPTCIDLNQRHSCRVQPVRFYGHHPWLCVDDPIRRLDPV